MHFPQSDKHSSLTKIEGTVPPNQTHSLACLGRSLAIRLSFTSDEVPPISNGAECIQSNAEQHLPSNQHMLCGYRKAVAAGSILRATEKPVPANHSRCLTVAETRTAILNPRIHYLELVLLARFVRQVPTFVYAVIRTGMKAHVHEWRCTNTHSEYILVDIIEDASCYQSGSQDNSWWCKF